jgi:hypothetical protein
LSRAVINAEPCLRTQALYLLHEVKAGAEGEVPEKYLSGMQRAPEGGKSGGHPVAKAR